MEALESIKSLAVKQKINAAEIIGFGGGKKIYSITNESDDKLFVASVEGGGLAFLLNLLHITRPFTAHITDSEKRNCLTIKSPFNFYFKKVEITDSSGQKIGEVRKKISFLQRSYSAYDHLGNKICDLTTPLFKAWEFNIIKNGKKDGKITKKWKGFGKEMFTVSDTFGVIFPESSVKEKAVLLGAVFLIDFVHFESH